MESCRWWLSNCSEVGACLLPFSLDVDAAVCSIEHLPVVAVLVAVVPVGVDVFAAVVRSRRVLF